MYLSYRTVPQEAGPEKRNGIGVTTGLRARLLRRLGRRLRFARVALNVEPTRHYAPPDPAA
jgi:hypothetical protein